GVPFFRFATTTILPYLGSDKVRDVQETVWKFAPNKSCPLIVSTKGPRTSRKSTHFQRGHWDTPRSGRGGRRFKSCHSDQRNPGNIGLSYNCPNRSRFSGTVNWDRNAMKPKGEASCPILQVHPPV